MKTKNESATSRNITKRLSIWAIIVAAVLMIPVVGRWPWDETDFIFGFVLLFGSASVYEFVTKKMIDKNQRMIVGTAIFIVLAILWVGAATG